MDKLKERKEQLEVEFAELKERRAVVIEKGKELQQELNMLDDGLKRLNGGYLEVTRLLGEDKQLEVEDKEKKK